MPDPIDVPIGLFKHVDETPLVENGLADATPDTDYLDEDGNFKKFYSRDNGVYNSRQLPLSDYNNQFDRTPGKYSGKMRLVVQLLMSRGRPIVWDYRHAKSHGILTSGDKLYAVEVSADGVFIETLPVLDDTHPDHFFFGVTPAYSPVPLDRVQIATAAVVAPFFDKTGMFNSCGFAFNENGTAAVNTCFTIDPENDWVHTAYLYKLTISTTNASLSLIESGEFGFGASSGFKVPDFSEQKIVHFACQPNPGGVIEEGESTIYAFYLGNTLTKVKTSSVHAKYEYFSDDFVGGSSICTAEFPGRPEYWGITYKRGTEYTPSSQNCFISQYGNTDNVKHWDGRVRRCSQEGTVSGQLTQVGTSKSYTDDIVTLNAMVDIVVNGTTTTGLYCIIPLFDRCAVYQTKHEFWESDSHLWGDATATAHNTRGDAWTTDPESDPDRICRRMSTFYPETSRYYNFTGGLWSGTGGDGNIICTPVTYGEQVCNDYGYVQNENKMKFSLFVLCEGSAGVQLLYTDDTTHAHNDYTRDDVEFQAMASYPDAANGNCFCSNKMNGLSGPDYHFTGAIDKNKYPVNTTAVGGWILFWTGKP